MKLNILPLRLRKIEILLALSFTFISSFIILLDVSPLRYCSAVLLFCFLPGYAFVQYFFKSGELDGLEKIPVSVLLSLTFVTVGYYIVHSFVVSFSKFGLILFIVIPTIFLYLLALLRRNGNNDVRTYEFKKEYIVLIILFLFTLYFRFTGLGYSEYHADEAYNCIIKSIDVLSGNKEIFFSDKRPPTQIIIPTLSYFLTGNYNEFNIRLPFALAGSVSIIVVYLLGKLLFGKFSGFIAGFLLAVNGFHIAFSRTVQYQAVTVLAIIGSIYLLAKFLREESGETARKYLFLAFTFYAFSLFSHYEFLPLLPLIFYPVVKKYGIKQMPAYKSIYLPAFMIFLFITLVFYIPYVLNPNIKATLFDHILKSRIGVDFNQKTAGWHFNPDYIFLVSTYYNSGVYFLSLLAFAIFSLYRIDFSKKFLFFWFIIYFLPLIFFKKSGTHVQNAFPALCLLAASGIGSLYDFPPKRLSQRLVRIILLGGFIIFLTYCSLVIYIKFINQEPEYHYEIKPEVKDRIYAHFGFPYHRGWKAVGYLFRSKYLQGSYKSYNEKDRVPAYYLRQKSTESDLPRYIIMTVNPRHQRPGSDLKAPDGYCKIIDIIHKEKKTIEIYERTDCENKKPVVLKSEDYEEAYDLLDKNPENLAVRDSE